MKPSILLQLTLVLLLSVLSASGIAQTNSAGQSNNEPASGDAAGTFTTTPVTNQAATVINRVALRIGEKQAELADLQSLAREREGGLTADETQELDELSADIERLEKSLILAVSGQSTLNALYQDEAPETTWQQDIVDILKPLADSLKSLTRKPRQIAELRVSLELIQHRQSGLQDAIRRFSNVNEEALDAQATSLVSELKENWQEELDQAAEEQLLISRQLQELEGENEDIIQRLLPNLKAFTVGPALTLLIALLAAFFTWSLMRAAWWLYSRRIASKEFRRRSTLYRFFNYSYQLITIVIIIVIIVMVLYVREELLLLALAFVLLAGAFLNLRQFLPRYIAEARTLLNLGSIREDERVVYNGLPWMVRSINIYSVLHNPALDGIVRLPLAEMNSLVSRPVRNRLWFPTQRGDYVILPDGLLGQIKVQTPDLVEISVRGGMALTFPTNEFYRMSVINLSRDEHFGVSVTFGLDYSLQAKANVEIPQALKEGIEKQLETEGYSEQTHSLIVELSAAGASSLDFLVFATFDKSVASDYFRLERLLLQSCVEVSTQRDWTIPFPQLTIHQQAKLSPSS